MKKQPNPPQIGKSAYVGIDTDGRIIWSWCCDDLRLVSEWCAHLDRRVARVEVVEIVRKSATAKRRKGGK